MVTMRQHGMISLQILGPLPLRLPLVVFKLQRLPHAHLQLRMRPSPPRALPTPSLFLPRLASCLHADPPSLGLRAWLTTALRHQCVKRTWAA